MRGLRTLYRTHRKEHGQALFIFAGGLVIFLGLVGLSVDTGLLVYTRTDLQKAADAAVLAAAQELPAASDAIATGEAYVMENTGPDTGASVQVSQTNAANDTVSVTATREVDFFFVRFLGLNSAEVSASATARAGVYNGGSGILPWGLIASNDDNSTLLQNSCYISGPDANGDVQFRQNQQCTLKFGAGSNSGGDFGALSLGGNGANRYRNNIANGSTEVYKRGDKVNPETGNMVGPTRQGIAARFSQPVPEGCPGHGRDQVLIDNPDGSVSIRPGCEASPRIVIIPVVDRIDNPHDSTILGFAFMYLTGSNGSGGHAEVSGEFVHFVTEIPGGIYNGTGNGARSITLVE